MDWKTTIGRVTRRVIKRRLSDGTTKEYKYFICTFVIPDDIAKEFELEDVDYLIIKYKRVRWYHLLDWYNIVREEDKEFISKFPMKVKKELVEIGLAPKKLLEL